MNKIKMYTLKNGLKLIFYQDNTKHTTVANLFIKFGGTNKNVLINNKQFNIIDGTAHFLEHLLIEHSIYGNALIEFEKNRARFNGYTNKRATEFFIDSVYNFEEDLIKLINIVNNPNFNSKDIEETKPAIIKEKMMNKDNKFVDLLKKDYECAFKNIKYSNTLGEVGDISNMDYEYLKKCYDVFYQPKNQILFISGNFNLKKVKKIIETEYSKFNNLEKDIKILKLEEPKEVVKKEEYIIKDTHMDYVKLNYKVNISHLSNKQRVKLSFYLYYFLTYLFNASSKTYNKLVKEKICDCGINYDYIDDDDYILITIGTYANKHKQFIKEIEKTMSKKELNEEFFELEKKKTIIDLILREDNLNSLINPFIDNIISFGYYGMDTIEDVEEYNFLDYKNIIENLDFSNYCITKMIKKKN